MDVLEAIGTARAMRWFRSDPVAPDLVDRVLWAATRASSPGNVQPWDFVVVRDPEVRARIASLFAAVVGPIEERRAALLAPGLDRSQRHMREGALHLIGTTADVPVIVFVCGANVFPAVAPEITWMYSAVYGAAQNLIVAARALGLGTVFTTLHQSAEPALRELLAIPDDRIIGATMPLGWPARPFGLMRRRPLSEVVHHDRW